MQIQELKLRRELEQNPKLKKRYFQFGQLIDELKRRKLSEDLIQLINDEMELINAISDDNKALSKQLRKSQSSILSVLEKKANLVTKNHYRTRWMAVGMAAFGIPLGAAFGASMGNMAFLGIGLPIGMKIGMGVGAQMDKKAAEEGRQLDTEIKL